MWELLAFSDNHLPFILPVIFVIVLWVKYSSSLPWFVLEVSSFTLFIIKAVLESDVFTSVLQIQYIYTIEISELDF